MGSPPDVSPQEGAAGQDPAGDEGAALTDGQLGQVSAADEGLGEQAPRGQRGGLAGLPVTGTLSTRYRFRSDSEDDHDLTSTLGLRVGDPDQHPASLHILAWGNANLDGRSDRNDPFFDINDTYSKDVQGRLYEAFVDWHAVDALGVLRFGRQPLYDTPEYVSFDGVRLESNPLGDKAVRLGAYGGVPVHHFESSSNGDAVVGAYADGRPWQGGRARLDYMYLEDRNLLGDHNNDLLGAAVWHTVNPKLRLEGAYSMLEGASRDVRARATWFEVEQDLVIRATYYELLRTQRNLVTELDPFYQALREYHPFREAHLLVSKGFSERYRAEVGAQVRRLADDDDEGVFNRDFERYHARFVVDDVIVDDLALGLGGEILDAGSGKYSSWSADLERRWNERWRSTVGTFYALYDFDLFALRERNDVRVYFLDLGYRASDSVRLSGRYEFEDDDLDDYHVLRMGLTWRF